MTTIVSKMKTGGGQVTRLIAYWPAIRAVLKAAWTLIKAAEDGRLTEKEQMAFQRDVWAVYSVVKKIQLQRKGA